MSSCLPTLRHANCGLMVGETLCLLWPLEETLSNIAQVRYPNIRGFVDMPFNQMWYRPGCVHTYHLLRCTMLAVA